jgi:hypothetical protein
MIVLLRVLRGDAQTDLLALHRLDDVAFAARRPGIDDGKGIGILQQVSVHHAEINPVHTGHDLLNSHPSTPLWSGR